MPSRDAGRTNAAPLPYADAAPEAIEARSFAIIEAESAGMRTFAGKARRVALRLVHAAGDLSLLPDLHLPESAVEAGLAALRRGAWVFTDTEMARAGINPRRLEALGARIGCALSFPGVAEKARRRGITRSRAGMEALGRRLGGAVAVIGNAPTALLALLDYLDAGGAPPSLTIAMPVGFVNAAESKELILDRPDIPCLALRGRRGGSSLAAAALNALSLMALEDDANPDGACR
jgi:precorrin-8X/cobalt-precorrin-8 methylmutase